VHGGIDAVRPGKQALAPLAAPRRELWSSASLVFAGNLVARALGFLFPVVLARATDEARFALVYFLITTGWFVSELVLTGFPTAATRALAADRSPGRGGWLTSALAAGLPLLAVSLLAGTALALAADAPPQLMAFVVLGLTIDAYYFALLRGLQRFRLLAVYRVAANLCQILLLLGFVAIGVTDTAAMVALYSFVYVLPIGCIELARRPLRRTLRGAPGPSRTRIASLTRFAVPSLVSGTAYAAVLGLDVFLVRLLAPDALADYAAARTLALPMTFFPYAVAIVLLPRVAGAPAAQRWSLLRRALWASTGLVAAGILGYALVGRSLLELAFPAGLQGAAAAVTPLAAVCGLMGLYSILSQWWLGVGRPLVPAVTLSCGALAAVAAHLVLTSAYEALGAALAVGGGTTVALCLLGVATVRLYAHASEPTADRWDGGV
jgi:O-antigen/teichoic acid export membrane protein